MDPSLSEVPVKVLLVTGGRDQRNLDWVYSTLDAAVIYGGFGKIICGYNPKDRRYQGTDQLAYEWARENEFPCDCFPADWDAYGLGAAPRRNQQMVDTRPDCGLAFPRADGSWGKGTTDTLMRLTRAHIHFERAT